MEQQKVLIVILAVAVFVALVLGAGLWWFYPRSEETPAVTSVEENTDSAAEFDPIEWMRSEDEYPGLEQKEEEPEEFIVIDNIYGVDEEAAEDEVAEAVEEKTDKETQTTVVSAPKVTTTASSTTRVTGPTSLSSTTTVVAESRTETETKPVTKTVAVQEYWIQAGSFKSRSKADTANEKLTEKGLAARIIAKDVNGENYYRLRIGPYDEKAEAEKFLSWVHNVSGFESSYISVVYNQREVTQ